MTKKTNTQRWAQAVFGISLPLIAVLVVGIMGRIVVFFVGSAADPDAMFFCMAIAGGLGLLLGGAAVLDALLEEWFDR